jgi:putative ABC transport system ATP-binding protein
MFDTVIDVQNLSKSFHAGNQNIFVLKNITFSVKNSDFCIIFGPSGCGKSTLLHSILGLEPPTSGSCIVLDTNLYSGITEDECCDFRKNHIGMVYQQPNWIKSLTVLENISFPLTLMGKPKHESLLKSEEMLGLVGMKDWSSFSPMELSSGQQQKVALARALNTNPELIIADEPTGNLDFGSGQELMQLLLKLNNEQNKTILMVTHDLEYLKFAKTVIKMFNGQIIQKFDNNNKNDIIKDIHYKKEENQLPII